MGTLNNLEKAGLVKKQVELSLSRLRKFVVHFQILKTPSLIILNHDCYGLYPAGVKKQLANYQTWSATCCRGHKHREVLFFFIFLPIFFTVGHLNNLKARANQYAATFLFMIFFN